MAGWVPLWGVPTSGLVRDCGPAVAWCAKTASIAWVVGVECEAYEFVSSVWVVVSYGAGSEVAGYADWVAVDDCSSEGMVAFAVVPTLPCCTSCLVGLGLVGGAPAPLAGGVQLWATMGGAHSHGAPLQGGPEIDEVSPARGSIIIHTIMKNTLKYVAIIAAFISAGFAFSGAGTIAGALAIVAGILVAFTVPRNEAK